MKQSTLLHIEEFDNLDWFHSAGRPISSSNIKRVTSWKDAFILSKDETWEFTLTSALDDVFIEIEKSMGSDVAAVMWNKATRNLRKRIKSLLTSLRYPSGVTVPDTNLLTPSIEWNILGDSLSTEFSEHHHNHFFSDICQWYLAGRCPCGWEGDYPAGRLLVF